MNRDGFDKSTHKDWFLHFAKERNKDLGIPDSSGPLCAPSIFDEDVSNVEKKLKKWELFKTRTKTENTIEDIKQLFSGDADDVK